jgi:hypothetical protein
LRVALIRQQIGRIRQQGACQTRAFPRAHELNRRVMCCSTGSRSLFTKKRCIHCRSIAFSSLALQPRAELPQNGGLHEPAEDFARGRARARRPRFVGSFVGNFVEPSSVGGGASGVAGMRASVARLGADFAARDTGPSAVLPRVVMRIA